MYTGRQGYQWQVFNFASWAGLPDFSRHKIPKRWKIYQIFTELPNGQRIYQPFPIQGPPKFTQIGIFGLKIYQLATLP
jgi:hypothetical protein